MQEKTLTIAVDVDGVLANFIEHFISYYNVAHPDDLIDKSDITTYDFEGLKYNASTEKLWNITGFIRTLPLMDYAQEGLQEISKKHNVIVVTACDLATFDERVEWFQEFFPWFKSENLILAHKKSLINFDYIIDDSPSVLADVGVDKGICFSQCYNQHLKDYIRVNSWHDVVDIIDNLV